MSIKIDKDLQKHIGKLSWNLKNVGSRNFNGKKAISAYAIMNALAPVVDFDAMAVKCGDNPNHEHFGKTPEEIKTLWTTKKETGQKRGVLLDDYIQAKLDGRDMIINEDEHDENSIKKCKSFDTFFEKVVLANNLTLIGKEMWLNSGKFNIICRLDALFKDEDNNLIVFDWKNNEKISTENNYQTDSLMIGTLSEYDNCDWVKYTIQLFVYQYILQEEMGLKVRGVRIIQVKTDRVESHRPAFNFNKQLMEDTFTFAHEEIERRALALPKEQ